MTLDLHKKPFDDNTKIKLSLFKDYLRDWLPVFTGQKKSYDTVNIFDFFAGPGEDLNGVHGSPLIIDKMILRNVKYIYSNKITINVYLNEKNQNKYKSLKQLFENKNYPNINIHISNLDFEEAYPKLEPKMKKSANLLFLDQNGLKHITKDRFINIIAHIATDFLFFISSSTINRFCEVEDIKKYIDTSKIKIDKEDHYNIHRAVLNYYKELIPKNQKYYLAPFSIKKESNIYGLIFGSSHLLGIYKFLRLAWKKDPLRGEANFDIDRENITSEQDYLFEEFNKPNKVKLFEIELESKILNKELRTDKSVLEYTLTNGFLPKHIRTIFNKMIKDKKLPKQKISFSDRKLFKPDYKPRDLIHNV